MSQNIISLKNVGKSFKEGNKKTEILKDLNLEIETGEKVAIIGPSGSGKTTLLSILAGLDIPDSGDIFINSKNLIKLNEKELAKYRNEDIGIIFQSFELILPFTVLENVTAPQDIKKVYNKTWVSHLLEKVDLTNKKDRSINNLSGGEKQRTAIARSLSNNPNIILADEPTGSLDRVTGKKVLDLLIELVNTENKTLIVITHDEEVAKKMDKVYELIDKKLHLVK
jgi:ABC-type lipoprotein export system ATPase subunit